MDLSVIIVSWNVKNILRDNLKALLESKGDINFEVIVVDNASKDGSSEMVKKEFKQVKLIESGVNLGFGKGNNLGVRDARGEFILFLNPDMQVFPHTLERMVVWMRENRQAHIASCRLVDENGQNLPHVRRFPRLFDQLAIVLKLPHVFPKILNKYLRVGFDYEKPSRVDSVRGAFFMVSTAIEKELNMKVEFDERYFLWFEEVDFCKTIKKNGGEVWYTPSAKCKDLIGQSFAQVNRNIKQNYFRDSMLKYFKKWHPFWNCWILGFGWIFSPIIIKFFTVLKLKSKAKT